MVLGDVSLTGGLAGGLADGVGLTVGLAGGVGLIGSGVLVGDDGFVGT